MVGVQGHSELYQQWPRLYLHGHLYRVLDSRNWQFCFPHDIEVYDPMIGNSASSQANDSADPMQLVDELSMIYTTCIMFYATFSHKQTRLYRTVLGLFLVALAIFITAYYHYLGDPVFHQNMYALLTATVLFRSMYIMETSLRPKSRKREEASGAAHTTGAEQKRQDDRDRKILQTMWLMIACGLSVFLGGFGIWTLDNVFCSKLRVWRREIGLPWGILLEGHGWW